MNRIDPRGTTWICVGPSDDLSCFDDGIGGQTGGGGGNGPKPRPQPNDPIGEMHPSPGAVYTAALFSALAALKDPNCAGLFNTAANGSSGYSPADVLAMMAFGGSAGNIPAGTYFGSISSSPMPLGFDAVTEADPATAVSLGNGGVQAASAKIVLQANQLSDGYYGRQAPQDLALTLIHELGHVFNEVSGLGGSKIVSEINPDHSVNYEAENVNAATLQKCHPK